MKSVYLRILVWFFSTLVISMLAFIMVSSYITYRSEGVKLIGPAFNAMLFEEAIRAYESGGSLELVKRLEQLHKYTLGNYYLTSADGRDLATGEDRSSFLSRIKSKWDKPTFSRGQVLVGSKSSDNRYRLISVLPLPNGVLPYMLFYVLILLAVGMVCWALALSIASPLRNLARAVDRFGRGDLSIRVNSPRRDEIGALGKAFDQMAERIETLLTSERRLLQDISHELRSPLARLSFAVELVKRDPEDASIVRLKREIERLTHLVSALLEMTRAEADPSYGSMVEIRLDVVLNEVVEDCRVEAAARGCGINFDEDQDLKVFGNGELLRRAFENIVRNAIRYTPEGSSVDVQLKAGAADATIVVRDYGPGVPEELLSKIFQPFFRVDDSRDGSTGGVGLGLAIARRAIAVHHGRLTAVNANPGLKVQIELSLEPRDR
jgi:two-component system sensor histidine kinase CpxA